MSDADQQLAYIAETARSISERLTPTVTWVPDTVEAVSDDVERLKDDVAWIARQVAALAEVVRGEP